MIQIFIIAYLITLLASASILYTWFNSHLPQLVFSILKKLGFKRNNATFWKLPDAVFSMSTTSDSVDPLAWTDSDWESFAANSLNNFWGTLLTCPYCICYHFVFWCNFIGAIALFALNDIGIANAIVFLLASTASQPILVHALTSILARIQHIRSE